MGDPTSASQAEVQSAVSQLIARARAAQAEFERYGQEKVDRAVVAVAWAIYEPQRAQTLAELAVRDSGLGRVSDKVDKNRRKTLGTLRDLTGAPSVGVIERDVARGVVSYAKPMGVIAAICPSTNPAATPANKAMMAVKARNAIIISPSPKGASTARLLLEYIHAEFDRIGVPRDLVQMIDRPTKALTYELMHQADFVVVTGSQSNVRTAYRSGTPAIGVGMGNAPVIVDETADLDEAAAKIKLSKTFDYATSCSSENSVHLQTTIYDSAVAALENRGGYLLTAQEKRRLQDVMWPDRHLSPSVVAQPPSAIAELAGLDDPRARDADFFMVEEEGYGPQFPFSGEKLSVVLTVYRYDDLDSCLDRIQSILDYQGAGHSCGIHTQRPERAHTVAKRLRVARVLVNQAHCFGTGGSFNNGLGFTLTMGAGTWAGNSVSSNLSYRDFLNITRLATVVEERVPNEQELFGPYLAANGQHDGRVLEDRDDDVTTPRL